MKHVSCECMYIISIFISIICMVIIYYYGHHIFTHHKNLYVTNVHMAIACIQFYSLSLDIKNFIYCLKIFGSYLVVSIFLSYYIWIWSFGEFFFLVDDDVLYA